MIRVACALALVSSAIGSALTASGDGGGIFSDDFRWIYWVFAAASLIVAMRVLVKGTE